MKKTEKRLLFLAAGLFFLTFALTQEREVSQYKSDVQVRYFDGTSVSRQSLEQMEILEQKRNPAHLPSVAAWNTEGNVKVENPDLLFEDRALCIIVKGDKEQVIKYPLLEGGYGYRDDDDACVISKGTAWKLFGSPHVVGERVMCKGKQWVIRGVADSDDSFVILSAGRQKLADYQNLSFSYKEAERIQGKTEELMFRYLVSENGVVIDGSFYYAIVKMIVTFPFWAIFLMSCPVLAAAMKRKKIPGYRIVMIILTVTGVVILIKWGFCFPQEFIPSKWSDFGFWTEKFEAVRENMNQIAQLPKTFYDVKIISTFYRCILNSMSSLLFVLAFLVSVFQKYK